MLETGLLLKVKAQSLCEETFNVMFHFAYK